MISDLITLLEAQSFTCGTNIYVDQAPERSSLPYLIIRQTQTEYNKTLTSTGGLIFADMLLDCTGQTMAQADILGDEVETFIDDYTGSMGTKTCLAVLLNDRESEFEPDPSGGSGGRYTVTLDLQIQYSN